MFHPIQMLLYLLSVSLSSFYSTHFSSPSSPPTPLFSSAYLSSSFSSHSSNFFFFCSSHSSSHNHSPLISLSPTPPYTHPVVKLLTLALSSVHRYHLKQTSNSELSHQFKAPSTTYQNSPWAINLCKEFYS